MGLLAFIILASKRLKSRASLSLPLVLSFALSVALAVAVPEFSNAVSKLTMREEIARRMQNVDYPPMAARFYAMVQPGKTLSLEEARQATSWIGGALVREVGLPIVTVYAQSESIGFSLRAKPGDAHYVGEELATLRVATAQDIGKHIHPLAGEPFSELVTSDHLKVWLERSLADRLAVSAGETYQLIPSQLEGPTEIPVEIAGIWEAVDPVERFWFRNPAVAFDGVLLTTRAQYEALIAPLTPEKTFLNTWYYTLDERQMDMNHAEDYLRGLKRVEYEVQIRLPMGTMDFAPIQELEQGHTRNVTLSAILFGFSVPLLGLLIYFTVAISLMAARFQRLELATLTSRGSSRAQILSLILIESVMLLVFALPLGVFLGLGLANLMGNTQSFLSFAPRAPLGVHLSTVNWGLVGAVSAITLLARLVPTALATRSSIVTYEQSVGRKSAAGTATRVVLVLLLAGLTVYIYRKITQGGVQGLIAWRPGDNAANDPLVVLAPALYLMSSSLVVSEIFGLLMRPLALLTGLLPLPSAYLGCLHLSREGGQYRTPTFMLALCLSTGVFYASLARSADTWLLERLRYAVGADLTFEQLSATQAAERGRPAPSAWLLPISEYEKFPGVERAARVGEYPAAMDLAIAEIQPILRVMAIDRLDFPQVAYYRRDFSAHPLGELMNRLGVSRDGILLPNELLRKYQLALGDVVPLRVRLDDQEFPFDFRVAGGFDYFPTMYPDQGLVAIVNLDYLQTETLGAFPFGIWMRIVPGTEPEARGEILRQIVRMGVEITAVKDLGLALHSDQQKPERMGIFGMLSICFLGGAIFAGLGLLVYSALSIASRAVHLAVLQAIGMRRDQVVAVVSVEYVVTLLYSILAGTALGVWAARLYVPFLPLIGTSELPIPPFVALVDWQRAIWMTLLIGLVLVLLEAGLVVRVARARVFELLRMGVRP